MRRPLRIIGDGDQYKQRRRLAGPTVRFLGSLADETVRDNYAHCRAMLFPGDEDLGVVAVEAHSFGRPVVAHGLGRAGGLFAGEPPRPGSATGVLFARQSVESLVEALQVFESVETRFSPPFIRGQVERFDVSRFKREMAAFVAEKVAAFRDSVGSGALGQRLKA
jgi:glycosyltransferase involved in cell wall biosynthesis